MITTPPTVPVTAGAQLAALVGRNLRTTARVPQLLMFSLTMPMAMLVLFSQVFRSVADGPAFPAGVSYIGMAGTVAHFPVLRKALATLPKDQLRFGSKDEVRCFFSFLIRDGNRGLVNSGFGVCYCNAFPVLGCVTLRACIPCILQRIIPVKVKRFFSRQRYR